MIVGVSLLLMALPYNRCGDRCCDLALCKNNIELNYVTLTTLCLSLVFTDSLQAQLINMGVIPTLVKLLGIHSHNTALTEMCLIAFGNLAELGEFMYTCI